MIVTLGVRVLQIVFAGIVLALSVTELKTFGPGHAPSIYAYGAFCGGAALIIGAIGIVSIFIEAIQGIIMLALDAFATFFLLAGGLAMAVTFKVGNCSDWNFPEGYMWKMAAEKNGGPFNTSAWKTSDNSIKRTQDDLTGRCMMAQADTAFVWFAFAAAAAALALSFLVKRRGSSSIV